MKNKLAILMLAACSLTLAVGFESNGATTTKTDYVVTDSESASVELSVAYAVDFYASEVNYVNAENCICDYTELPAGYDVFVADNAGMLYDHYVSDSDKPTVTHIGTRFKPPNVLRC